MRKNDVSNWYINKHQGQSIPKDEIERKWRVYLWEQEQIQLAESVSARDAMNAAVSSGGGGSSIGPEPTPLPVLPLTLGWDDIANANTLVGDASSVSDWNTFFDLPTNGTPFTSVIVVGNDVQLYGGSGINLKNSLFLNNTNLLFVDDTANCIITAGTYCFTSCTSTVSFNLPLLQTAGTSCFYNCTSATSFNLLSLETTGSYCFYGCTLATLFDLPLCTNLGGTVGDDSVFTNISGNTITATFNSVLATCDGSLPDGDIQYLEANNTVTVTYV